MPKYWYVAKELGEDAQPEQVLKVMESLAAVAFKQSIGGKIGPFGFNKKPEPEEVMPSYNVINKVLVRKKNSL